MRITDEHIARIDDDGFVAIPGFLTPAEAAAALDGIHRLHAPPYEVWLAAGRKIPIDARHLFPWDDSGLNQAMTHPDLIDAAERLVGTDDLVLGEGQVGVKYAGGGDGEGFHIDYGNNTLGPQVHDRARMRRNPVFLYYFTDVGPGDAPIRMVRHGRPDDEAVPITGPAGTLCIYTTFTRHSATRFANPTGMRAVAWVMMCDARRRYDVPRAMTYKSGVKLEEMSRFIREASPRQLQLLGFPAAGSEFWSDECVAGMEARYPGFRGELYRAQPALAMAARS